MNEKKENYEILDSLRHTFTSFIIGGLYNLYVHQSNEPWYPKIVLKSELKPNYASQAWYEKGKRCVLKATIKKEDVFFSRQSHHEKEIAVNIEKLVHVQKT